MLPHRRSPRSDLWFSFVLGVSLTLAAAADVQALPEEDFEQRYFDESDDRYTKDHALVRDGDTYHLFYVHGNAGEAWNIPGNEQDLGHASSTDLKHWTVHGTVLSIDPANEWKARLLWSPHVTRATLPVNGQSWNWIMAYTGVDSTMNQRIGIAVSNNLFNWTDLSVTEAAYWPPPEWSRWDADNGWGACRDPFITVVDGEWVLWASAYTKPGYIGPGKRGVIALATSPDGVNWTDAGAPMIVSVDSSLLVSSHLLQNPVSGDWHAFFVRELLPGGVFYLTGPSPTANWDIFTSFLIDPMSISSEINQFDDDYVYSHVETFQNHDGLDMRGVRFDDLVWALALPAFTRSNILDAGWTLIEGNLGAQPTYGDRPQLRGGPSSNVEGRFWINTAEDFAGPYLVDEGCPTCAAKEEQVGRLRSDTFQVELDTIELWVGGTNSPNCRVALVDASNGQELLTETGADTDVMSLRQWDVSTFGGRDLYFEVIDLDLNGHIGVDAIVASGDPVIAVADAGQPAPLSRLVVRVAPNPVGHRAVINFTRGQTALAAPAAIRIYDSLGRLVRTLEDSRPVGDAHQVVWDGLAADGTPAAAGTYFVRVEADSEVASGRITLIR